MDLMILLAGAQSNPMHVCGLMLFEKPHGPTRAGKGDRRCLNATVISCNGSMDFGFVSIGASLHDLPALAGNVEKAWRELKQTAPEDLRGKSGERVAARIQSELP